MRVSPLHMARLLRSKPNSRLGSCSQPRVCDSLLCCTVPLFMDGALTASFRGERFVDDDYMRLQRRAQPALALPVSSAESVRIAVGRDPRIRQLSSSPGGNMKLLSREKLREIMGWGASDVEARDADGAFEALAPLRKAVV